MTDAQIKTKLNQLVKIANELDTEAKLRYGAEGHLFYESDGAFHLMNGDDGDGTPTSRQAFIMFSSDGYCRLGGGAW